MESLKFFIFFLFFTKNWLCSQEYYDSYGRKIVIDKPVKSIVAVGAGALRVVSYLDAVDMVKGVENIEVRFPKGRSYSVAYKDLLKKLPLIGEGGADKTPDYEKIKIISPDLIIASSLSLDLVENIERKTGIKVYSFDYGLFGSFETERFKNVIKTLSEVLNRKKRGDFLIKRVDYYSSDLKRRVNNKKIDSTVYVGGVGFKGSHGITSTQYDYEPFKLLGIKSVVDSLEKKQGMKHIFIDYETLLRLNPDYLFIDLGGIDIFLNDFKQKRNFYASISAFKKGNVYTTLPFNYYTTNVDVVFINAYFIGKVLFSDSFKDVDIKKICSKIMIDFVKKDVCDEFIDDKRFYKRVIIKRWKH